MFSLSAKIEITRRHDAYTIKKSINKLLREKFSKENMKRGQPIYKSELTAFVNQIEGVVSCTLNQLCGSDSNFGIFNLIPEPNEIFIIDPKGIKVEIKSI